MIYDCLIFKCVDISEFYFCPGMVAQYDVYGRKGQESKRFFF